MAEDPLRIAIKLRQPHSTPYDALRDLKGFLQHAGVDLSALQLDSLIESLERNQLAELADRVRRRDARLELDFSKWLQIIVPPGIDAEAMVRVVRILDTVETAYVMRPVPPPGPRSGPGPGPGPDQGYLEAAPDGIGARAAWGIPGGDGSGIGFLDIEQGWNLDHEDLPRGIKLFSGVNRLFHSHGTGVLGQVLMRHDNLRAGLGIAPSATARVASVWRSKTNNPADAKYNPSDAICDVVKHAGMAFGDVLLLEVQAMDPAGSGKILPVEVLDDAFDAIRAATADGIVVIEAAANDTVDLDAYTNIAGRKIFDRRSADFRDSGAIIVGASSSTSPHHRLVALHQGESASNFGNRVDCYAWGEKVFTTISDTDGKDTTSTTDIFFGTSSASAIVAGAALVLQGLARASRGGPFDPSAVRSMLTTHGTPSANPATDKIGIMPDLAKILAAMPRSSV